MATKAQNPREQDGSGCSRRGFLRRGAASAGAVGAIAAGGSQVAPHFSPVGRAQAIAPAAVGAYLAVGAASGYAVSQWQNPDTTDGPAPGETLESWIYDVARATADGRESFVDEMEHEFLEPDDPEQTPFGRSAWSKVRAAVAREAVQGGSEADAESAAMEAVERQTTIAVMNLVERWNTGMNALIEAMVTDQEEDVGVFETSGDATITSHESVDHSEPIEASEISDSGNYLLFETELEVPTSPSNIDEMDRDDATAIGFAVTNGSPHLAMPVVAWAVSDDLYGNTIKATHSDYGTSVVLDTTLMNDVSGTIKDAYESITEDLSEYVSSVFSAVHEGAIDAEDILSPQDVADHFADSSEQERFGGELLAIGAQVPDSGGYQALVSHDDLASEEIWAMIYPQFTDEPIDVSPGTTIDADEYEMAYIGYESAADGSWQTDILSGEYDLEIHDVDGVSGQEAMDYGGDSAGEGGELLVHAGDDVPEPIEDRNEDEYADWIVTVSGETSDYQADLSDVEADGDEYVLPETDLEEGEEIEYIEILPTVGYSRTADYVADPTEVDDAETVQRLEDMSEHVEELEEALEGSGGGGGIGDWIGDGPGGMGSAAIGAIAVLLAIVGIGNITS